MDTIRRILGWNYTKFILIFLVLMMVVANLILSYKLYGDHKLKGIYEFEEMVTEDENSVVYNAYMVFEKKGFTVYEKVYNERGQMKFVRAVDSGKLKKIYKNVYTLKSPKLNTYISPRDNYFYLQNTKEDYIVKFKKSRLKAKDLLKLQE